MNNGYSSKEEIRELVQRGRDMTKVHVILPQGDYPDSDSDKITDVAVYCRVSTDGIGQTLSFELQKKFYIKYVQDRPNWRLIGLYSDEGISATTVKNRIGLQMMIEDAKAARFKLIVIKSISRFCRNLADSIRIIKELKALPEPVGIFFETEGINTLDPATDLIIKILSILAEEESKKKSEAITASVRQRYGEGLFMVPPVLGYYRTGVNQIDIDPDEAVTVRVIYDMFLAGYSPDAIVEVLCELGRKKHTHRYVDGRVREGSTDWTADSVLNVLLNEKRCGDVLAQKTYTVDCIEHIVRKNQRRVKQYYAKDQHPAIISREQFYLAQKLQKANKGGWNLGVQTLETCMDGIMQGYVKMIPAWNGFDTSDYVVASLKAYGIDVPEDSIYPEYVSASQKADLGGPEQQASEPRSDDSVTHYYEVSEEEFRETPRISEEEWKLLSDNIPEYIGALRRLRSEAVETNPDRQEIPGGYIQAEAWKFSLREKPMLTVDKNGVTFRGSCLKYIGASEVEMYFNPVTETVRVCAGQSPESACNLKWVTKDDDDRIRMVRCSAQGACKTFYSCMDWAVEDKYVIIGRKMTVGAKVYLEFPLQNAIARMNCRKKHQEPGTPEINESDKRSDKLEIIEEARNSGAYYAPEDEDLSSCIQYISGNIESKSRAIYFKQDDIADEAHDNGEESYTSEQIRDILMKSQDAEDIPEFIRNRVKRTKTGFEIYPEHWKRLNTGVNCSTSDNADQAGEVRSFGWPTEFTFPTKEDVKKVIEDLKNGGTGYDMDSLRLSNTE